MLTSNKKKRAIKEFSIGDKDTGSVPVQVALLTKRIDELTSHLKKNPKDNHSRRGLLMMVGRRRRLLSYFEKHDEKGYKKLVKKLNLKK
ncbi:MAG: 30S ribosomal protein S15 [Candidatus Harrisonbacteria bacterium CG10_big_fil_rev_8_21_14_0_10_44_23]|uniref:Small ribosomal subunit protein uS15 n=1 Tax=Candidatus Harrisonbacteria bacterium CG10_big_fil_rev_8_21_14_0_10_44_23 TaxID=1974585 RepID=A0A2H0UT21_9BACT|nr:MAG: 30S ribosomal protein S15 [Candidatus Harrisonbacteria bacterium CG10_big_fil_rev_8_21_14_0_10_44_23]